MDLASILAELKAVEEEFKRSDRGLATASFCQRASKTLDRVVREADHADFDHLVVGIWIVIGTFSDLLPQLVDGPLLTELVEKLFRQCARVVLDIKWQQLGEESASRQNFQASLSSCHKQMAPRGFTRFGVLQALIDNPWTDPTLTMVMGSEEDNEEGEGLAYVQGQDPEILKLRVELMQQENCDEFALNLCTWCLKHPALTNDFKLRKTQFILFHHLSYVDRLQEECQTMDVVDSIGLINSLQGSEEHKGLATVLAQTVLVQNWIKPSDNDAKKELLQLWIRLQYQADEDQDRFISSLWAVAKVSHSTEQLLFIIDAVREQCGDTFLQFYLDLCVFAINVDKGCWEKLKDSNMAGPSEEIQARKRDMATVCDKLALIVSHVSPKVSFCCALTAFSMLPSEKSLQAVVDAHQRKNLSKTSQCCSNCASDQGECLKQNDGDKTCRDVNIATLYEVERLCGMLRPPYLNPDSDFSVLFSMCKQYLLKENGEAVKSALVRWKSTPSASQTQAGAPSNDVPQYSASSSVMSQQSSKPNILRSAVPNSKAVNTATFVSSTAAPQLCKDENHGAVALHSVEADLRLPAGPVGQTIQQAVQKEPDPSRKMETANTGQAGGQNSIQQLVLKQMSSDMVQTLLHLIEAGQISPVHLNQIMTKTPNMSLQTLHSIVSKAKSPSVQQSETLQGKLPAASHSTDPQPKQPSAGTIPIQPLQQQVLLQQQIQQQQPIQFQQVTDQQLQLIKHEPQLQQSSVQQRVLPATYTVPRVLQPNSMPQRLPVQPQHGPRQQSPQQVRLLSTEGQRSAVPTVMRSEGAQLPSTSQPLAIRPHTPSQVHALQGLPTVGSVLPSISTLQLSGSGEIQGTQPVHVMTFRQPSSVLTSSGTLGSSQVLIQTSSQMLNHLSGGSVSSLNQQLLQPQSRVAHLPSAVVTPNSSPARSKTVPKLIPKAPGPGLALQTSASSKLSSPQSASQIVPGNRHYSINNLLFTGEQQNSAMSIALPDRLPEISVDSISDTLRALSDSASAGSQQSPSVSVQTSLSTGVSQAVLLQSTASDKIILPQTPAKPVKSPKQPARRPSKKPLSLSTAMQGQAMATGAASAPQQTPQLVGNLATFSMPASSIQSQGQSLPSFSSLFSSNRSPLPVPSPATVPATSAGPGPAVPPDEATATLSLTQGGKKGGQSRGQKKASGGNSMGGKSIKKGKEAVTAEKETMMQLLKQAMTINVVKKVTTGTTHVHSLGQQSPSLSSPLTSVSGKAVPTTLSVGTTSVSLSSPQVAGISQLGQVHHPVGQQQAGGHQQSGNLAPLQGVGVMSQQNVALAPSQTVAPQQCITVTPQHLVSVVPHGMPGPALLQPNQSTPPVPRVVAPMAVSSASSVTGDALFSIKTQNIVTVSGGTQVVMASTTTKSKLHDILTHRQDNMTTDRVSVENISVSSASAAGSAVSLARDNVVGPLTSTYAAVNSAAVSASGHFVENQSSRSPAVGSTAVGSFAAESPAVSYTAGNPAVRYAAVEHGVGSVNESPSVVLPASSPVLTSMSGTPPMNYSAMTSVGYVPNSVSNSNNIVPSAFSDSNGATPAVGALNAPTRLSMGSQAVETTAELPSLVQPSPMVLPPGSVPEDSFTETSDNGEQSFATYRCIICAKAFMTLDALRLHVKRLCKPESEEAVSSDTPSLPGKTPPVVTGLETSTVFQCMRCFELCISEAGIRAHKLVCSKAPKPKPKPKPKPRAKPKPPKSAEEKATEARVMELLNKCLGENREKLLEEVSAQKAKTTSSKKKAPKKRPASEEDPEQAGAAPKLKKPKPEKKAKSAQDGPVSAEVALPQKPVSSESERSVASAGQAATEHPAGLPMDSATGAEVFSNSSNNSQSKEETPKLKRKSYPKQKKPKSVVGEASEQTDSRISPSTDSVDFKPIIEPKSKKSGNGNETKVLKKAKKELEHLRPRFKKLSGSGGRSFFKCLNCGQTLCSIENFSDHWQECIIKKPPTVKTKRPSKEKKVSSSNNGSDKPVSSEENIDAIIDGVASGLYAPDIQIEGSNTEIVVDSIHLGETPVESGTVALTENTSERISDTHLAIGQNVALPLESESSPGRELLNKLENEARARTVGSEALLSLASQTAGNSLPVTVLEENKDDFTRREEEMNVAALALSSVSPTVSASVTGEQPPKEKRKSTENKSKCPSRKKTTKQKTDEQKSNSSQKTVTDLPVNSDEKTTGSSAKKDEVQDEKIKPKIKAAKPESQNNGNSPSKAVGRSLSVSDSPSKKTGRANTVKAKFCGLCQRTFGRQWILVRHLVCQHLRPSSWKRGSTSYPCQFCQEVLLDYTSYKAHVMIHTDAILKMFNVEASSPTELGTLTSKEISVPTDSSVTDKIGAAEDGSMSIAKSIDNSGVGKNTSTMEPSQLSAETTESYDGLGKQILPEVTVSDSNTISETTSTFTKVFVEGEILSEKGSHKGEEVLENVSVPAWKSKAEAKPESDMDKVSESPSKKVATCSTPQSKQKKKNVPPKETGTERERSTSSRKKMLKKDKGNQKKTGSPVKKTSSEDEKKSSSPSKKTPTAHSGEKVKFCQLCKRSFSRQWVLVRHLVSVHLPPVKTNTEVKTLYSCHFCQEAFSQSSVYRTHIMCHADAILQRFGLKGGPSLVAETSELVSSASEKAAVSLSDHKSDSSPVVETKEQKEVDSESQMAVGMLKPMQEVSSVSDGRPNRTEAVSVNDTSSTVVRKDVKDTSESNVGHSFDDTSSAKSATEKTNQKKSMSYLRGPDGRFAKVDESVSAALEKKNLAKMKVRKTTGNKNRIQVPSTKSEMERRKKTGLAKKAFVKAVSRDKKVEIPREKKTRSLQSGEKTTFCRICQRSFSRQWVLLRHLVSFHLPATIMNKGNDSCFCCQFCEESFSQLSLYKTHSMSHPDAIMRKFDLHMPLSVASEALSQEMAQGSASLENDPPVPEQNSKKEDSEHQVAIIVPEQNSKKEDSEHLVAIIVPEQNSKKEDNVSEQNSKKDSVSEQNSKKEDSVSEQNSKKEDSVSEQNSKKEDSVSEQNSKKEDSVSEQNSKKEDGVSEQNSKKEDGEHQVAITVPEQNSKKEDSTPEQNSKKEDSTPEQNSKKEETEDLVVITVSEQNSMKEETEQQVVITVPEQSSKKEKSEHQVVATVLKQKSRKEESKQPVAITVAKQKSRKEESKHQVASSAPKVNCEKVESKHLVATNVFEQNSKESEQAVWITVPDQTSMKEMTENKDATIVTKAEAQPAAEQLKKTPALETETAVQTSPQSSTVATESLCGASDGIKVDPLVTQEKSLRSSKTTHKKSRQIKRLVKKTGKTQFRSSLRKMASASVHKNQKKTDDSVCASVPKNQSKNDSSVSASVSKNQSKTDDSVSASVPKNQSKTDDSVSASVHQDQNKNDDSDTQPKKARSSQKGEPSTWCRLCQRYFCRNWVLVQHIASRHVQPYTLEKTREKTSYICHLCPEVFPNYAEYIYHIIIQKPHIQTILEKYNDLVPSDYESPSENADVTPEASVDGEIHQKQGSLKGSPQTKKKTRKDMAKRDRKSKDLMKANRKSSKDSTNSDNNSLKDCATCSESDLDDSSKVEKSNLDWLLKTDKKKPKDLMKTDCPKLDGLGKVEKKSARGPSKSDGKKAVGSLKTGKVSKAGGKLSKVGGKLSKGGEDVQHKEKIGILPLRNPSGRVSASRLPLRKPSARVSAILAKKKPALLHLRRPRRPGRAASSQALSKILINTVRVQSSTEPDKENKKRKFVASEHMPDEPRSKERRLKKLKTDTPRVETMKSAFMKTRKSGKKNSVVKTTEKKKDKNKVKDVLNSETCETEEKNEAVDKEKGAEIPKQDTGENDATSGHDDLKQKNTKDITRSIDEENGASNVHQKDDGSSKDCTKSMASTRPSIEDETDLVTGSAKNIGCPKQEPIPPSVQCSENTSSAGLSPDLAAAAQTSSFMDSFMYFVSHRYGDSPHTMDQSKKGRPSSNRAVEKVNTHSGVGHKKEDQFDCRAAEHPVDQDANFHPTVSHSQQSFSSTESVQTSMTETDAGWQLRSRSKSTDVMNVQKLGGMVTKQCKVNLGDRIEDDSKADVPEELTSGKGQNSDADCLLTNTDCYGLKTSGITDNRDCMTTEISGVSSDSDTLDLNMADVLHNPSPCAGSEPEEKGCQESEQMAIENGLGGPRVAKPDLATPTPQDHLPSYTSRLTSEAHSASFSNLAAAPDAVEKAESWCQSATPTVLTQPAVAVESSSITSKSAVTEELNTDSDGTNDSLPSLVSGSGQLQDKLAEAKTESVLEDCSRPVENDLKKINMKNEQVKTLSAAALQTRVHSTSTDSPGKLKEQEKITRTAKSTASDQNSPSLVTFECVLENAISMALQNEPLQDASPTRSLLSKLWNDSGMVSLPAVSTVAAGSSDSADEKEMVGDAFQQQTKVSVDSERPLEMRCPRLPSGLSRDSTVATDLPAVVESQESEKDISTTLPVVDSVATESSQTGEQQSRKSNIVSVGYKLELSLAKMNDKRSNTVGLAADTSSSESEKEKPAAQADEGQEQKSMSMIEFLQKSAFPIFDSPHPRVPKSEEAKVEEKIVTLTDSSEGIRIAKCDGEDPIADCDKRGNITMSLSEDDHLAEAEKEGVTEHTFEAKEDVDQSTGSAKCDIVSDIDGASVDLFAHLPASPLEQLSVEDSIISASAGSHIAGSPSEPPAIACQSSVAHLNCISQATSDTQVSVGNAATVDLICESDGQIVKDEAGSQQISIDPSSDSVSQDDVQVTDDEIPPVSPSVAMRRKISDSSAGLEGEMHVSLEEDTSVVDGSNLCSEDAIDNVPALTEKSAGDPDPDNDLPELCIEPDPRVVVCTARFNTLSEKSKSASELLATPQKIKGVVLTNDDDQGTVISAVVGEYEVKVKNLQMTKRAARKVAKTYCAKVEVIEEKAAGEVKEIAETGHPESPTGKPMSGVKSLRSVHNPVPFVWDVEGEEESKKQARNERLVKAFRENMQVAPFSWETDEGKNRSRTDPPTQCAVSMSSELSHNKANTVSISSEAQPCNLPCLVDTTVSDKSAEPHACLTGDSMSVEDPSGTNRTEMQIVNKCDNSSHTADLKKVDKEENKTVNSSDVEQEGGKAMVDDWDISHGKNLPAHDEAYSRSDSGNSEGKSHETELEKKSITVPCNVDSNDAAAEKVSAPSHRGVQSQTRTVGHTPKEQERPVTRSRETRRSASSDKTVDKTVTRSSSRNRGTVPTRSKDKLLRKSRSCDIDDCHHSRKCNAESSRSSTGAADGKGKGTDRGFKSGSLGDVHVTSDKTNAEATNSRTVRSRVNSQLSGKKTRSQMIKTWNRRLSSSAIGVKNSASSIQEKASGQIEKLKPTELPQTPSSSRSHLTSKAKHTRDRLISHGELSSHVSQMKQNSTDSRFSTGKGITKEQTAKASGSNNLGSAHLAGTESRQGSTPVAERKTLRSREASPVEREHQQKTANLTSSISLRSRDAANKPNQSQSSDTSLQTTELRSLRSREVTPDKGNVQNTLPSHATPTGVKALRSRSNTPDTNVHPGPDSNMLKSAGMRESSEIAVLQDKDPGCNTEQPLEVEDRGRSRGRRISSSSSLAKSQGGENRPCSEVADSLDTQTPVSTGQPAPSTCNPIFDIISPSNSRPHRGKGQNAGQLSQRRKTSKTLPASEVQASDSTSRLDSNVACDGEEQKSLFSNAPATSQNPDTTTPRSKASLLHPKDRQHQSSPQNLGAMVRRRQHPISWRKAVSQPARKSRKLSSQTPQFELIRVEPVQPEAPSVHRRTRSSDRDQGASPRTVHTRVSGNDLKPTLLKPDTSSNVSDQKWSINRHITPSEARKRRSDHRFPFSFKRARTRTKSK